MRETEIGLTDGKQAPFYDTHGLHCVGPLQHLPGASCFFLWVIIYVCVCVQGLAGVFQGETEARVRLTLFFFWGGGIPWD